MPCGVGNVLTNKGAVCLLLRTRDHTLAFINAHLAAHEPKLEERNANYHRIRDTILSRADDMFSLSERGAAAPERTQTKNSEQRNTAAGKVAPPAPLVSSPVSLPVSLSGNNVYLERLLTASGMPRDKVFMPFFLENNEVDGSYSAYQHEQSLVDKEYDDVRMSAPTPSRRSTDISSDAHERGEWPFDAVFFFGDLNYRIRGMSRSQMDKFIEHVRTMDKKQTTSRRKNTKKTKKTKSTRTKASSISVDRMQVPPKAIPLLNRVLHFDQLLEERKRRRAFSGFQEGDITFLPTYKYDQGSADFDSSEKNRCPSWTDRVLYRGRRIGTTKRGVKGLPSQVYKGRLFRTQQRRRMKYKKENAERDSPPPPPAPSLQVELQEYCSFDVRHSDHRPVVATFLLKEEA